MNLTWTQAQDYLRELAHAADEYAGIPCPVPDLDLVVHPKYQFYGYLQELAQKREGDDPTVSVINSWESKRLGGTVVLYRDEQGRVQGGCLPSNRIGALLNTLGAVEAWSLEAERKALDKLATLVKHHIFRMYMFTGSFIETSKRSKVTYIFRRCRPTVAMKGDTSGGMRVLCHLCLHPIGYYSESFAGSMVPTDEVVAHLLLMRGDEHAFWKWSNQHSSNSMII